MKANLLRSSIGAPYGIFCLDCKCKCKPSLIDGIKMSCRVPY